MGDTSTNTTSSRRRLPGKKSPQNDGYKEGKNKGKAHRDYSNAEQARKRNPGKHDRWANKYDVDGGDFRVYGKGKGRRRLPIQDADTPTNTLNAVNSDTTSSRRSLMFRNPRDPAARNFQNGQRHLGRGGAGMGGRVNANASHANAGHHRATNYNYGDPTWVQGQAGTWACGIMSRGQPCGYQNTGLTCGRQGCPGTSQNH